MALMVVPGDLHVAGRCSAETMTIPVGTVIDASIPSGANIATTKTVHRIFKDMQQTTGTAILADVKDMHICRASGTVLAIEAAITGLIATGADRTVTVDVHKSTAEGAFATILSATVGFTNASVLRRVVSGTISSAALVDGDILRIVVTVAGAAGNQAQGLVIALTFDENPQ